ncbi:PR domain zinc finger protein 8-like isoform X2 [Megalops cyprinoides]|nr:PR domain zinc finger protein 8-like isoform X2 [Megalops cyprinoides]
MMEAPISAKLLWEGDAKAMQQCLTDMFTSVFTTCDIPENAIFGPCVLSHTSLYDSIAFIALKSKDKRTAPYIFRVDTSATCGSSEGRLWLRLVQPARDSEEQNLEAYVKNGQLFYRSLRRIEKDEELLVWYGRDLSALLLLRSSRGLGKNKGEPPYLCPDCNQHFQFEFPFLAHLRFCCARRLQSINGADEDGEGDRVNQAPVSSSPKMVKSEGHSPSQDSKPATDFHNLARDLENSRTCPASDRDAEIRSRNKRKFCEEENRSRSLSPTAQEDSVSAAPQYRQAFGLGEGRRSFSPPGSEPIESKKSAFTEVKKTLAGLKQSGELSPGVENRGSMRLCGAAEQVLSETQPQRHMEGPSAGSAFSSVPRHAGSADRKSAFSQPGRSAVQPPPLTITPKLLRPTDCPPALGDPGRLYPAGHLAAKPPSVELLQAAKHSPFLYTTAFWPKAAAAVHMQVPPALTLLPPSLTSLGLPAQNWCAKCNASFRMTSDLVYHMRSHHKKELALEPLVKRRREEKLRCPICNESFRERHHLSRHMTSHN